MKDRKQKVGRAVNMGAWILIGFLACYVILKSCVVFGSMNLTRTFQKFGQEVLCNFSETIIYSASPLLQYTLKDETAGENLLTSCLKSMFPIEQYAMAQMIQENWEDEEVSGNAFVNEYPTKAFQGRTVADGQEEETNPQVIYTDPNSIIYGEVFHETSLIQNPEEAVEALSNNVSVIKQLQEKKDFDFLMSHFYVVDSSTKATKETFQISKLLSREMSIKKDVSKPQILIFHTHSQETFYDSRAGKTQDTIVGVGDYLTEILTEEYGYNVIHDKSKYDIVNGQLDRNKAYNQSLEGVKKQLEENPSVKVVIDLHRDGAGTKNKVRHVTTINGKKTAKLMFFNGLSRNTKGQPIEYLKNPKQEGNLAFSLQLQLKAMENYPDFTRKIYLRNYRYNMHLRERFLLIELGNEYNTVEEAKNAMEPLAKILNEVLEGK